MHYLCNQWSSFYVVGLFSLLRKVTLSNIVWCIVACFIRLSKVLSLSHFAFMEISGIKHWWRKKTIHHGSLSVVHVDNRRSNVDIVCWLHRLWFKGFNEGNSFAYVFLSYQLGPQWLFSKRFDPFHMFLSQNTNAFSVNGTLQNKDFKMHHCWC